MARTLCFTSFSFSYLARARVMARSLRAAHPDWHLRALIVDRPPRLLDHAVAFAPFDDFIYAAALGIPGFPGWLFKHDLVEACTAVKGRMLCKALEQGFDRVIYLDPDIAVFAPLSSIEQALDGASIVLTPHQVTPNSDPAEIADNEMTSLRYGVYNLGFLAVRNDANGVAFARWWAEMTARACYDEVDAGLFTDQKYCDLVPGLFDGVRVVRDPGCNVASWNLSQRHLWFDGEGTLRANTAALKFYHFTKIGGVGDVMTERYAGDNVEVYEIVNWYKRELAAQTLDTIDGWQWHYGRFSNGDTITKPARVLYRRRADLMAAFDDPFRTQGDSYWSWLEREAPELLESALLARDGDPDDSIQIDA